MADSKKDARQKAAEARAAQQAADKRRERTVRIVGGLVVLIVIVAIIGGAIFFSKKDGSNNGGTPTPDAGGATPNGVSTSDYYVTAAANTPAGVPTVKIYEDFQCPYCKKLEETAGPALVEQAKAGKLNLQWQPGIFMDANLKNTGSLTATNAWGCAIDAGKTTEFHQGVFQQCAGIHSAANARSRQNRWDHGGRLLNVRIVCESKYLQHVGSQQQRTVREGWGYEHSVDLCER